MSLQPFSETPLMNSFIVSHGEKKAGSGKWVLQVGLTFTTLYPRKCYFSNKTHIEPIASISMLSFFLPPLNIQLLKWPTVIFCIGGRHEGIRSEGREDARLTTEPVTAPRAACGPMRWRIAPHLPPLWPLRQMESPEGSVE